MNDSNLEVIESEARGIEAVTGRMAIKDATPIAQELSAVVEQQKLYTIINQKKYVWVEGWSTMGAMVSVFPHVVALEKIDTKPIKGYLVEIKQKKWNKFKRVHEETTITKFIKKSLYNPKEMKIIKEADGTELREVDEIKYQAIIELRSTSGTVIGRAIHICSNLEEGKLDKPEYAIASMAETRATGKAFRLAFAWIMKLAGYESTPNEERESESITIEAETVEGDTEPAQPEKIEPNKATAQEAALAQKAEKEKKEKPPIVVPKDPAKQKELWKTLVDQAKKVGVSVQIVCEEVGTKPPIKIEWLPKLIPALAKANEEMMEKLEHPA